MSVRKYVVVGALCVAGMCGLACTNRNAVMGRLFGVQKSNRQVQIIAHRGFSEVAPENTLSAARHAIGADADGCEFDVHLTKDGQVIVCHDDTIDRTTNGQGKISEMTLAELQQFDAGSWKSPTYAGERLPTLDEMLDVLLSKDCTPVIEIKALAAAKPTAEIVKNRKLENRVLVISFIPEALAEVKKVSPKITTAWLYGDKVEGATAKERAEFLLKKAQAAKSRHLDLAMNIVDAELVKELQRRGDAVIVWTVDSDEDLAKAIAWGVDAITTNVPDKAVAMVKK